MTISKITIQKRITWAVFIAYVVAVIMGLTNHEPWRDEGQAWMVVRDMSFGQLFKTLPSEGHPPLWYLLITPLVKTGMPYESQNWLTLLIAVGAVHIILFHTRFHIILKVLIPFSYFFLYEYALFARNYCLILIFIAAIISLYPRRFEKPWLFALAVAGLFNTHVLLFSFCGTICILYAVDMLHLKKANKQTMGSLVLMLISGLYLIPYLFMSRTTNAFHKAVLHYKINIHDLMNEGLMTLKHSGQLGIIFIILVALTLLLRPKPLVLLIGGLSGVVYILLYKYVATIRHDGVICMIVLGTYGIALCYEDDPLNILKNRVNQYWKYSFVVLAAILVIQLKQTSACYSADNQSLYSDSKNAAEFIKDNGYEGHFIIGQHAYATTAIIPYLGKNVRFYDAFCDRMFSYLVYDSCYFKYLTAEPVDYVFKLVLTKYKNNPNVLYNAIFVLNKPVKPELEAYLNRLYATQESTILKEEKYFIYSLRKDVPL